MVRNLPGGYPSSRLFPGQNFSKTENTTMERATCTVLIVEDDALLARAIRRTLATAGIAAEVVSTVRSACERMVRGGLDLIITDLALADGTGHDLLDVVRDGG